MRYRMLLLYLVLFMIAGSFAFGEELKTDPAVVELTGQFIIPKYRDTAADRIGKYLALELDNPIDVAGDKFGGPVKGIRVVQMLLTGDPETRETTVYRYKGSRVKVTGTLIHAHAATHRTKVVLKVQKIQDQYPDTNK